MVSVEFDTLLIAVEMLYSRHSPMERSEVSNRADGRDCDLLSLTKQRRKLKTHRLLFLNHVDQAVQHWSKVSKSGRWKTAIKMEENINNKKDNNTERTIFITFHCTEQSAESFSFVIILGNSIWNRALCTAIIILYINSEQQTSVQCGVCNNRGWPIVDFQKAHIITIVCTRKKLINQPPEKTIQHSRKLTVTFELNN